MSTTLESVHRSTWSKSPSVTEAGVRKAKRSWLSLFGSGIGVLCALHCALVPLVFLALPSLKLALYSVHNPQHVLAIVLLKSLIFERWLVWAGVAITVISLLVGQHWRTRPVYWIGLGLILTLIGSYIPGVLSFWHTTFMLLGGCILLIATLAPSRDAKR